MQHPQRGEAGDQLRTSLATRAAHHLQALTSEPVAHATSPVTAELAITLAKSLTYPLTDSRVEAAGVRALETTLNASDRETAAKVFWALLDAARGNKVTPNSPSLALRNWQNNLMLSPEAPTKHSTSQINHLAWNILNTDPDMQAYEKFDDESLASMKSLAAAVSKPHVRSAYLNAYDPENYSPEQFHYLAITIPEYVPELRAAGDNASADALHSFGIACLRGIPTSWLPDYHELSQNKVAAAEAALADSPANAEAIVGAKQSWQNAQALYAAEIARRQSSSPGD